MQIVDSHAQVFARASAEFPRETDQFLAADREEPVELLLDCMESSGVDQAVLVQLGGTAIEHHAYLLRCLRSYPDRFRGIALLPKQLDQPERHMDSLADSTGIIGFKLALIGGPYDPFVRPDVRQFAAFRIWQHAANRDYVLWLELPAVEAHLVPYLLEAFPQVRVVFTQLGIFTGKNRLSWDRKGRPRIKTPQPCSEHLIHTTRRLTKYENVMVQLSAQYRFSNEEYPYRDYVGCHQALHRIYGSKRLMWATDYPWTRTDPGYKSVLPIVRDLLPDLSEQEHQEIMGGTARSFLRLPAFRQQHALAATGGPNEHRVLDVR